ncbi:hypothetical protein HW932_21030 [Allochromatium humboldtianum]|uniref:Uncharacterized protein n=1 Tax=Allochromatium humboldtianum TaxID=504901 RepID=A0A850RFC4_9GAMM|nr:hypothetical protein [Allochromatium humboldtianum]NVZ11735.1 hypothetical protein [Allochromatium humboldtianum]
MAAYLDCIGETDPVCIREFLEVLEGDLEQRRFFFAEAVALGLAIWETGQESVLEVEAPGQPKVACARCVHWIPNKLNPEGGLGRCLAEAPASKRIGSLWPGADDVRCERYRALDPGT